MILCSHKKNVDKYNDFLIHKTFQNHELFVVIMEINAMGITMKKRFSIINITTRHIYMI